MRKPFNRILGLWLLAIGMGVSIHHLARGEDTSGFSCKITAVTCGKWVTTSTEFEGCGVLDIAQIGKVRQRHYARFTFFVGYRLGQEMLFLGGGSAKAGMLVTCKVPFTDGQPDYGTLKKELPKLLTTHPSIKKKFPKLRSVEIERGMKFEQIPKKDQKKILGQFPFRHHDLRAL